MGCGSCGKNKTVFTAKQEPVDMHGETDCQCVFPAGETSVFCSRHNVIKSKHQCSLCRNRKDYFQLWEEGRGAFQTPTSNAEIKAKTVKSPEEKQKEQEEAEKRMEQMEQARQMQAKPTGLGDTVEKFTKLTGIKTVIDTVAKLTGKDCGCEARKEFLNRRFPYKKGKTKGFFE